MKDLWVLAGCAMFAMGTTFLAATWHIQTYVVAH